MEFRDRSLTDWPVTNARVRVEPTIALPNDDFADTAALVANLDLVRASADAQLHIAGSGDHGQASGQISVDGAEPRHYGPSFRMVELPPGFTPHPKIVRLLEQRAQMAHQHRVERRRPLHDASVQTVEIGNQHRRIAGRAGHHDPDPIHVFERIEPREVPFRDYLRGGFPLSTGQRGDRQYLAAVLRRYARKLLSHT